MRVFLLVFVLVAPVVLANHDGDSDTETDDPVGLNHRPKWTTDKMSGEKIDELLKELHEDPEFQLINWVPEDSEDTDSLGRTTRDDGDDSFYVPRSETMRGRTGPTRVIAFGDIHGDMAAMENVWDMITETIGSEPKRQTAIVCLGDLVDRGSKDKQVVEFINAKIAEGYRIYLVSGNHELMVASGDWSYRNMYSIHEEAQARAEIRAKSFAKKPRSVVRDDRDDDNLDQDKVFYVNSVDELVEKDKREMLTCNGNYVFKKMKTTITLDNPRVHSQSLIFTHGGMTIEAAERIAQKLINDHIPVTLSSMSNKINELKEEVFQQECVREISVLDMNERERKRWDEYNRFHPPVNRIENWAEVTKERKSNRDFKMGELRMTRDGSMMDKYRHMICADEHGEDDLICETPWEARRYYNVIDKGDDTRKRETCTLWTSFFDSVNETPTKARMVVGHTPDKNKPRSFCNGRIFGVDTLMSSALCDPGEYCPYSIIIFENFGRPDFDTNPIIVRRTRDNDSSEDTCELLAEETDEWSTLSCRELASAEVTTRILGASPEEISMRTSLEKRSKEEIARKKQEDWDKSRLNPLAYIPESKTKDLVKEKMAAAQSWWNSYMKKSAESHAD